MRQFLITVAGVVVGMVVFFVVAPFILIAALIGAASSATGVEPAGDTLIVELDLRPELADQSSGSALGFREDPSIVDIVETLERAESDPRVRGVFVRASEFGLPFAQAQEIEDAIARLRAANRFAVVHSQGFEGPSFSSYLAASSADEIWLQASANFVATGVSSHTLFFGGLLDRIGVEAEFERFEEFKTAPNAYTETTFTPEHRASLEALLESLLNESVNAAAAARGLEPQALRALIEAGPYDAETALDRGLVDRLGHLAEARDAALERAGDDAEFISLSDYQTLLEYDAPRRGPAIALVQGQGVIATGEGEPSLFGGEQAIFSDAMSAAIDAAAEDDDVRAIVLRVDSPGGSATASDQIHNAIARAREDGLPVIASFGAVAASGGYYIAAGADEIWAQPTTVTGSIGVFGGKLVIDRALANLDLNIEPLAVGGEFTLAYSAAQPFSARQRTRFREMMANTYDDFTMLVAEGRGMAIEDVREVARGRVWSGADAHAHGLVDGFGGLRDAVDRAAELAGLEPDADIVVRRYPAPRTAWEELQDLFGASASSAQTLGTLNAILSDPEVRAIIAAREEARTNGVRVRAPMLDVD